MGPRNPPQRLDKLVLFAIILLALVVALHMLWTKARPVSPQELVSRVPVHETLASHRDHISEKKVIKVTDGVWVATGFALANSILLEAPEGAIIVDTTESLQTAEAVVIAFKETLGTEFTVKGIIYTHNHADHMYGAEAFVSDPDSPPEVWAHHTMVEQLENVVSTSAAYYSRAMRQFGVLLPPEANPDSYIELKLGEQQTMGTLRPTNLVYNKREIVQIAGLEVELIHIPGETPDQMGVWLPDTKVFMSGDNIYKAFPNLYAIRGSTSRHALYWIQSIDLIRALRPEFLVPSHGVPLKGSQFIYETLTEYRDAIQYVHDQTVRYINLGYHPHDIVNKVKIPEESRANPFLAEVYGTVDWSVRGVFSHYMGWFSGEAAELESLGTLEKAYRMVALAGGLKATNKAAQTALDNNDPQWALELATHALKTDPASKEAKKIRRHALRLLASQQSSFNGRNYYLTMILEDHELVENKINPYLRANTIARMVPKQLFIALQMRLDPEMCEGMRETVVFHFTDINETYSAHVRRGILDVEEGHVSDWSVKVTLSLQLWRDIMAGVASPLSSYMSGDMVIDGGALAFRSFMGCFDRDT